MLSHAGYYNRKGNSGMDASIGTSEGVTGLRVRPRQKCLSMLKNAKEWNAQEYKRMRKNA